MNRKYFSLDAQKVVAGLALLAVGIGASVYLGAFSERPLDPLFSEEGASNFSQAEFGQGEGQGSPARGGGKKLLVSNQSVGGKLILPRKGTVQGHPLLPSVGGATEDKGRVVKLDRSALKELALLKEGAHVLLPSVDGGELDGTVHLVMQDGAWVRVGGTLPDGKGTFSLGTNFDEVGGSILLPELGMGYEIRTDVSGDVLMVERRLGALVCWPGLPAEPSLAAAEAVMDYSTNVAISQGGTVPEINTRPGAKGLLYLDFDGEVVTDPSWNGGRTINATPSTLSADQIREVVARVAEDYAPFDLAISTVRSDYDKAPVGRRMRLIVTPTNTAAPGAGGVSFIGSWNQAGRNMSSTVPGWVFASNAKNVAEAASHEAGHTFGLSHDGSLTSEYYSGHGGGLDVVTSWAPIMGNGYARSLTQWSKGEYVNANNREDDLAVISSTTNGIGYRSDVPSGGALMFSGNNFQVTGSLKNSAVADVYEFKTGGGSVRATALPQSAKYTDVDLQLSLTDAQNTVLATASPVDGLGASVTKDGLPAGVYRLQVRSAGTGVRPANGYTTGYSEYGSLGGYTLSGAVTTPMVGPVFSSATSVSGVVGTTFIFPVQVSGGASVSISSGALPSGLSFDTVAKSIKGTPTVAGQWSVTFLATSDTGTSKQDLVIRIEEPSVSLATVLGGLSALTTGPIQSPWVGNTVTLANGQTGLAAVSGRLGDGGSSRLQFVVPSQTVMSFWWKVSSERGHDFLTCRVNGIDARDADSGQALAVSGESGWVKQRVILSGRGDQLIEFAYLKDANLSVGQDRGWIYGVEISRPPSFKTLSNFPRFLDLKVGDKKFTLSLEADSATSYQWFKDGVALKDGTSGEHVVSGANQPTLTVSGVVTGDSGIYRLAVSNETGKIVSPFVEVTVPGLPEITQQPVAPVGLKVGDGMMLSTKANGTQPMYYLWTRNGVNIQWGTSSVLQIRSLKASDSGKYQAWAVNRFGYSKSEEIQINIAVAVKASKASRR